MAALKIERRSYLWYVTPRPNPARATKNVTLEEILDILGHAYKNKQAVLHLDGEMNHVDKHKNRVYIADLDIDKAKGYATFLINRGDPIAADPAFIDDSSTVKHIRAKDDETQGWSAHLVIKINSSDSLGRYRACFERMPNVSSSLITSLFQDICAKFAKDNPNYTYEKIKKINGKKAVEQLPYKPRLEINKQPSANLAKDLQEGTLSEIILINHDPQFAGPDHNDFVRKSENIIKITPKKDSEKAITNFLKSLSPWASEKGYDEIQFKLRNLPGDISVSPKFSLEEDALDTLYSRSERLIDFKNDLERCYEKKCDEIVEKMIALLNDNTKW